jgi:hypothetical protein
MTDYLSVSLLAQIAGLTNRAIERAVVRSLKGSRWRGAKLTTRAVSGGRGGRGGVQYEILASSLPAPLQLLWREQQAGDLSSFLLRSDDDANDRRAWWAQTLAPALIQKAGSPKRTAAMSAIAAQPHMTPDGEVRSYSIRTIRRMVERYDDHGTAGLQKLARRDRGTRRVTISTAWDRETQFDEPTRERVAGALRDKVRSLCRSGYVLSKVEYYAFEALRKLTREAGFDDEVELRRICRVPRRIISEEMHLRVVARKERDAKAHADATPSIRRTRTGIEPMQVVVGDVHPIDILMRREDGSTATPRMVAWLDVGTGRVFASVFLLDKGKGITAKHVIASFMAMTQHIEFGLPRLLHLDNGSEYQWPEFIDCALKLAGSGLKIEERHSPIIRAKPYNARSKIIEGTFGVLERNYFSEIPGWIGGDRMRSKTANVGQEPEPFPGTIDQLRHMIDAHLTIYHGKPQRSLGAVSPNEKFAQALKAGWQRSDVEIEALCAAFSTEETRQVVQGGISVNGERWTCAALQTYLRDRITVLIPKFEDWNFLPLKDPSGRIIGYAEPDRPFHYLDPEGARESARRAQRFNQAITRAGREVPLIDRVGEAFAAARLAPPAPAVPSRGVVTISEQMEGVARRLSESPETRMRRKADEIGREQERQLALIAKRKKAMGEG